MKHTPKNLKAAAAEVYQAVGVLLYDLYEGDTPKQGVALMDLLSWMSGNRKTRPRNILPYDSARKHKRSKP